MQKENQVINFFSNPLVGIIGSIASLLGLLLAVLFYYSAEKAPELVYSIHPTKNVLVNKGMSSDISVFYKNSPITDSDIVAVTLSIWNDGNESIRESAILEPIIIEFGSGAKVLEATVTKISRSVTGLTIDRDDELFKRGIIPLKWKILEGGDGGNIQIIYAGSKDLSLKITGIIEEQGEPIKLTTFTIENETILPFAEIKVMKWLIPSILIFAVILTITSYKSPVISKHIPFLRLKNRCNSEMPWIVIVIASSPFIFVAIYIFLKLDEWYPPFGF